MTPKYDLTKAFHRQEDIEITLASWVLFKQGKTNTLDFIVAGELVMGIPPVENYKHYKIINYIPPVKPEWI